LAKNGSKLKMEGFAYLEKAKCYSVATVDDVELYKEVT